MLSWEIRKQRIIFLLKTIFRIDWVASGRVYHRPCCQSQCYPGNGGKRKGPAAAGGSVHIPAAQHGTRLLSTSCQRWATSSQTTERHILGDDPFRVTTSWVLTQAFLTALLSIGRSYSNRPNFVSFLYSIPISKMNTLRNKEAASSNQLKSSRTDAFWLLVHQPSH